MARPLLIAGQWRTAPATQTVYAPWTGAPIDDVSLADDDLIDEAIESAHVHARAMADVPSHRRRDALVAIAHGIGRRRDALADLIAREAAKPITYARVEVDRAAQTFALGAEESTRLGGESMRLDHTPVAEGAIGAWVRVPAGPVLAITPFNFPLNLVAHKLAPAFAIGAPVVLKPAPQTPLTSLMLAEIVLEAGLPAPMLSVVPTSNERADRMVRDARFAVVSFTGSDRVGWALRDRAGKKRVMLELGGNASAIVAPDADLDRAVSRLTTAAFAYAGQVCIKAQNVYVHRDVHSAFLEAYVERSRGVVVADPLEPTTVCASMIDEAAAVRVESWVAEALAANAQLVLGGTRNGNRFAPSILVKANAGLRVVDDEVFGPVVNVHSYDDVGEAIASIERGRFGLQAGLFTHDVRTISRVFAALRVGALIVNDAPTFRVDAMPYGGVKDSGQGREGVRYAIEEMTERKLLVLRGTA